MVTVNLSMDQLAEAVQNLNDEEKNQIRHLLDDDIVLTDAQKQIISERRRAYDLGEQSYSPNEVQQMLNYIEE